MFLVFFVFFAFFGAGLVAAAYAAAALLHEGGHALAGHLFKARCLWIRVGGLLWVPGGGIFIRAGYGKRPGECVLSCPDKKSCAAAALGGGAANLITGAGAGLVWLRYTPCVWAVHPLLFGSMAVFSFCSLVMALLNLWPNRAEAKNDGAVVKALCMDEGFYKRLRKSQQKDFVRLEFGMLEEMF